MENMERDYTKIFKVIIARELRLDERCVENVLKLLADGCTIPFIARYRKEKTGGMDEVDIGNVSDMNDRLTELAKRKETVCKTIIAQEKMTADLQRRIDDCWDANEIEDIYLPYKPKRRTRAQIAREHGLEPLATIIMLQRERSPEVAARRFVGGDVEDEEQALAGAKDIIAEMISEDERARNQLRSAFRREAVITSRVVKAKKDSDEAAKYSDYFDFSEPLKRCSGNRLLAIRRAENEGIVRVDISVDEEEEAVERLCRQFVRGRGACQTLVEEAARDAYQRLLKPSIETEFAALSKLKADEEAIDIFAENLRQLLLQPPLGQKRVLAVDPGIRTGCKVVCLDALGNLLKYQTVFPFGNNGNCSVASREIQQLVEKYECEAIAVGNGTAGRQTLELLRSRFDGDDVQVFEVSEDGASVYSASKIAREEFPDQDVTVRGAVSIGRRLMDPLAELVKIDPRSMGVGQYQHDVDQVKLRKSLEQTVESCVNQVGVNVNTASVSLLTYVSGLGPALAKNIVDYRSANGPFTSRAQLKKVPRLGASAFQQCAGFLRISNPKNPLDASAVHPESYGIVEKMAKDANCTIEQLMSDKAKREEIDLKKYVTADVGMPTLTDIMTELDKPGRDPRAQIEVFEYDPRVNTIEDVEEGMVLPGIVTNITKFGAFVDIGVHQDGLVHVSQLANKFVSDPTQVVKLHQHVRVRVIEVDLRRKRISLSMKRV